MDSRSRAKPSTGSQVPDRRKAGVLLGAHMSIAGGVHRAVERGMSIGCTTMQIFVKNNNRWQSSALTETEITTYKELLSKSTIAPVVVHDTYLINLCATNPDILRKSRAAFKEELDRCELLGAEFYNFHPGAHMGAGEGEGIKRIAESLNVIHERTRGYRVKSVLETTAGQGSSLGFRFEQMRGIIDQVEEKDRMAVCVDTCHIFAAGYELTTEEGYHRTFGEFDAILGLDRLVAFHVNDAKRERGSRIDRHEHIGKGRIGLRGFRFLMNDERFARVPKILETEKGPDMKEDVQNMRRLKALMGGKGRARRR